MGNEFPFTGLGRKLALHGFEFIDAAAMRRDLEPLGFTDWQGFAESWDDLGVDRFMADGGRYRRRRHAAFAVSSMTIRRKPHQPHYQSRDYNPLNGGIQRWFDPVKDEIGGHPVMLATLRFACSLFDRLTPEGSRPDTWHVEVHQFRIEANAEISGLPTPEGKHRDGVDWVLVLLVARVNARDAATVILDQSLREIGNFTLETPLDSALVDDGRVYHAVTPLHSVNPGRSAHRDVLVITFRR